MIMLAVIAPLKCSHLALQAAQLLLEGLELFLKRGNGCSLALSSQADRLLRGDLDQLGRRQSKAEPGGAKDALNQVWGLLDLFLQSADGLSLLGFESLL